jgi:hypothetical protein
LLSKVGLRGNTKEISNPFNLFVEGNRGLSLEELPFWRTELEWLDQDFQEIFKMYREKNRFEEVYEFNDRIKGDLEEKTPFMMGRIGNTELWILKEYLEIKENYKDGYSKFWLDYFYTTSGFFSKGNQRVKEDIDRYAELTLDAIKNCDYHETWGGIELAEGLKLLLDHYKSKNSIYIPWDSMIVPNSDNNLETFIDSLEGKKVLVVSPYSESVKNQYPRRETLFRPNKKLPSFTLITYQSLETQLGNNQGFSNWFEAYRHMVEDIKQIDFDVSLLCCGAYGFPLASEIKNMGKQSLELCSYLPNWFGIKIKRYATCEKVNRFWNSSWSFPLEGPPKNSYKIENSCYWQ